MDVRFLGGPSLSRSQDGKLVEDGVPPTILDLRDNAELRITLGKNKGQLFR